MESVPKSQRNSNIENPDPNMTCSIRDTGREHEYRCITCDGTNEHYDQKSRLTLADRFVAFVQAGEQ
jgi:hypothetical protein